MKSTIKELRDDIRNLDWSRQIISALIFGGLIGGIFGGLAFSVVSPLFIAGIQDWQVNQGWISEPEVKIDLDYKDDVDIPQIINQSKEDLSLNHIRIFFVEIKNPTNKQISSIGLDIFFSGCISDGGLWISNIDSSLLVNHAQGVKVRINEPCSGNLIVENLPPKRVVHVYYIVNISQPNPNFSTSEPLANDEAFYGISYTWRYEGRTYHASSADRRTVDKGPSKGEQLN